MAAALAGCNADKSGKKACLAAAVIWAKGWRDNDLSLSSDATAALRADDLVAGSATAISTPSGAWGIRADGVAAIAASVAQNNRANYGTVVIAH